MKSIDKNKQIEANSDHIPPLLDRKIDHITWVYDWSILRDSTR
jgi:hypothetical protein